MRSQVLRHSQCAVPAASAKEAFSTDNARPTLPGRLGHLIAWIDLALQLGRERRDLARLSDQELRDIGVTRAQAEQESYRGIADIPPNRLKRNAWRRR